MFSPATVKSSVYLTGLSNKNRCRIKFISSNKIFWKKQSPPDPGQKSLQLWGNFCILGPEKIQRIS